MMMPNKGYICKLRECGMMSLWCHDDKKNLVLTP